MPTSWRPTQAMFGVRVNHPDPFTGWRHDRSGEELTGGLIGRFATRLNGAADDADVNGARQGVLDRYGAAGETSIVLGGDNHLETPSRCIAQRNGEEEVVPERKPANQGTNVGDRPAERVLDPAHAHKENSGCLELMPGAPADTALETGGDIKQQNTVGMMADSNKIDLTEQVNPAPWTGAPYIGRIQGIAETQIPLSLKDIVGTRLNFDPGGPETSDERNTTGSDCTQTGRSYNDSKIHRCTDNTDWSQRIYHNHYSHLTGGINNWTMSSPGQLDLRRG